jgi:hypothetical protein
MMTTTTGTTLAEDAGAVFDLFSAHGVGDGFPVVPPTPALVDVMVAAGGRPGDEELGRILGRPAQLTVAQAAVCAVLSGALPEYFPVVLATWDAIFDPAFNAGSVLGSSAGTAVTGVVSGPYSRAIGMNHGHNVLGPGNRANATIGRAVRLGAMLLGYHPGELDGASFGNQARYTAHFAESPPPPPWRPLRARMGFPEGSTTVTVAVTDAPRQVTHILSGDANNVLAMFATSMRDLSHAGAGRGNPFILVVGPEHAAILQSAGWTEAAIAEHLATETRVLPSDVADAGMPTGPDGVPFGREHVMALGADGRFPITTADQVLVVTAGGTGAGWSAVIFGYAPTSISKPVTKEVRLP